MRNAILLLALLLSACSNHSVSLPSIKPYRMDIQQGNVVDSKMLMQLRPGMTRAQVRFIMGTPLLTDSFHANRWDYLYRMQKGGRVIEQRHVILEFEGDQLVRVRGDVIPADATALPATAEQGRVMTPVTLEPKPKQKEKGLLDRLKFWESDEEAAKAEVEGKAAPAPAAVPARPAEPVPATPAPAAEAPARSAPAPVVPAPAPAPQAEAASKAEAAPAAAPPARPATVPRPELKTAPRPADDLPPEDDPSYFERMLEKIGF